VNVRYRNKQEKELLMRDIIKYMLVGLASVLIFIFLQHNFYEKKSSDNQQQAPQECPTCLECPKCSDPTALDDCLVSKYKRVGYTEGLLEGYTGVPVDSIEKTDLAKLTQEQSLRLRIVFDNLSKECL
jgi:hypothetical protein